MAKKFRLGAFVASLESDQSEQGTVQKVDAVAVKSSLEKPEVNPQVKQPAPSDTTGVEVAPDGGDDFTAIDKESIAQGEAIHKQLVRLTDAETSLESYLGILREARTTGKTLGRGTAAVMAYDLKSQYPNFFAPVVASLEAIDEDQERLGNNSSSKEVALSKDAEAKGEGRLGKLKAAGVEAWKKFMAWLKERWTKLKEIYTKIFGRTQKVKQANAMLKADPSPETAKKVVAALGAPVREARPEKDESKVSPSERKRVTVANIGVLSGADPMDIKKGNLAVMTDIYNNWMKPTEASVKEVLRLMLGDEEKQAQMIDMRQIANEIIKVDYTPAKGLLPSNYTIEATENRWGFKMVQHDQPETITDVEAFGGSAVTTVLATNDSTLDIAIEMGEAWVRITNMIDKISNEVKFIMNIGAAADLKKHITEYLTTLSNSDMVPLTKLMIQACTVRLLLCTEMTDPGK